MVLMEKLNPDSKSLIDSFNRVKANKKPIERECALIQESELFSLPLESYRKLFELYAQGKINEPFLDDLPKFDFNNWKKTLLKYWKWLDKKKLFVSVRYFGLE